MKHLRIMFSVVADARAKVWGIMKVSQFGDIAVAVAMLGIIAVAAAFQTVFSEVTPSAIAPDAATVAERLAALPRPADLAAITGSLTARGPLRDENAAVETLDKDQARLELEPDDLPPRDEDRESPLSKKRDLSYLVYYVYAELPPDEKPADIVLDSLKDVAVGTPVEEIKRASDAFGMNFSFMKAVAKIESDFDPKQRTGSYIGLFQLSHYEFAKYGSGDILNARDNAIAAAYKFLAEAKLFEWDTHKVPTFSDLYLIHQQGWQGAAEHVAHPDRIAWKSMCATDEGREKGEKWCKRAVWGNTLPTIKHIWKSVDNLRSGEFVNMWRERVSLFYSRYSQAAAAETKH
jgi:hypothetical protein